jgi:hypothetical protein
VVEGLNGPPLLVDCPLEAAQRYKRDDPTDEGCHELDVVVDGDFDHFVGVAGVRRVYVYFIETKLVLMYCCGEGKPREVCLGFIFDGNGAGNPLAGAGVALFLAGYGEADGLAGGVADGGLCLNNASEVYDAENEYEKERGEQGELDKGLAPWNTEDRGPGPEFRSLIARYSVLNTRYRDRGTGII